MKLAYIDKEIIMERARELFEKLKNQGKGCIDEFILARKSEELFLDFKRSADNGKGQRLNDNDRNNLAKAISGFSNSEGGLIVWGVECSRDNSGSDVASTKHPITNVKRFVSWLEGAVSGRTIPPNIGVQNHPVEIDSEGNGFVLTYIPKSNHAPHQDISSKKYYIRAGSNFVPTPHDVLAGMFGKRPQPNIKHNYMIYPIKVERDRVRILIGFHICNDGPGVAENLFASTVLLSESGPHCSFQFIPSDHKKDFRLFKSHNCFSFIGDIDIRLPPGGWLEVAQIILDLTPPFTKQLKIEGTFGCSNAPPVRFFFENSSENIQSSYDLMCSKHKALQDDKDKRTEIVRELLGMEIAPRL
jgi:Schlafen, AlbA_2